MATESELVPEFYFDDLINDLIDGALSLYLQGHLLFLSAYSYSIKMYDHLMVTAIKIQHASKYDEAVAI